MLADANEVTARTRRWLEHAVIGLNLCPFARAVHARNQIHYAISQASTAHELLQDFKLEVSSLMGSDANARETTLLVAPLCLPDFLAFNDCAAKADRLIGKMGFRGEVQLATFHPQYQFAGTDAHDIGNATNRAPYPTLHLLRESSIDRAVRSIADPRAIYEANINTLRALGPAGWAALGLDAP